MVDSVPDSIQLNPPCTINEEKTERNKINLQLQQ